MSSDGDSGQRLLEPHILTRFDGDLGHFRRLVLDMGTRIERQVELAAEALHECDVAKARQVVYAHKAIRDLDIDAMEANARLFAIHQPVAGDLRYVLTLSRAVYDLERIEGEAVRMADLAESLYDRSSVLENCRIFDDVKRIARPVGSLLSRSLEALAEERVRLAVEVALEGKDLQEEFERAIRRLATFMMEDPRNIRWVIDATLGIKAMERVGDHACSIARNLVYAVTGKDVRHVNTASLAID